MRWLNDLETPSHGSNRLIPAVRHSLHFNHDDRQIIFGRQAAGFGVNVLDQLADDLIGAQRTAAAELFAPLVRVRRGGIGRKSAFHPIRENEQPITDAELYGSVGEDFFLEDTQQAAVCVEALNFTIRAAPGSDTDVRRARRSLPGFRC